MPLQVAVTSNYPKIWKGAGFWLIVNDEDIIRAAEAQRKLQEKAEALLEAKKEYIAKYHEHQAAREAVDVREAELAMEVAAEVDLRTGKPLYPNAEVRAAALKKFKMDDTDYQSLKEVQVETWREMDTAKAKVEQLQDELRNLRIVCDLSAREMEVRAAHYRNQAITKETMLREQDIVTE